MTVEALSSNVVNYLVWRYLQEAGYGDAALQLSLQWLRDPETLPFAKNVAPHTLIHILQDGLWLDKLQADATHGERRYRFGPDHGRPYSIRNGQSLALEDAAPTQQLTEETNGAVQEPAPRKAPGKKKRLRVNGVVEPRADVQTNGDPMDVDLNGSSHVTNSVRAESEVVVSEPESPSVDIPISTLSIGLSTDVQTEQIADLSETTTFLTQQMKNNESSQTWDVVEHTLWGPSQPKLLLAAGQSLLRLISIPDGILGRPNPEIPTKDLLSTLHDFQVTAVCWNSSSAVTVAIQERTTNEAGEDIKTDKLLSITDGGEDIRVLSSAGNMFTTLRFNEATKNLLTISTNDVAGSIKIWKEEEDDPAWTIDTDSPIIDAAWTGDNTFVVCGVAFLQTYEISDTLKPQISFETAETWDLVKHDPISNIIACAAIGEERSFLGIVHPSHPTKLETLEYPEAYFSDLAFQPRPRVDSESEQTPVPLATGSGAGITRIYDANVPFKCMKVLNAEEGSPIHRVAFSPDGSLLATAGPEAVTIWSMEKLEIPVAVWNSKSDLDQWDPTVEGEFSLGWDPDGSRLLITSGNQMAMIHLPR